MTVLLNTDIVNIFITGDSPFHSLMISLVNTFNYFDCLYFHMYFYPFRPCSFFPVLNISDRMGLIIFIKPLKNKNKQKKIIP